MPPVVLQTLVTVGNQGFGYPNPFIVRSDTGLEWTVNGLNAGQTLALEPKDGGAMQVVVDPDSPAYKVVQTVRSEWVIRIDGKVRDRPVMDGKPTVNPELATGEVEVVASEIEVLSVEGWPAADSRRLGAALERELGRLLAEGGLEPPAAAAPDPGPLSVAAGPGAEATGARVASAVYQSLKG